MRFLLSASPFILLFPLLLAGCGQKGPLYLPSNKPAAQTDQSAANAADETGDDEAADDWDWPESFDD